MPQPKKGPRLASSPAHERLMLAGMATALFEYGHIKTTVKKAKRLQPLVERLITFAKQNDLAARRRVARVIRNKHVAHKLFTVIAPHFANRNGGYTRIIKMINRAGDNAPMAIIELVMESVTPKKSVSKKETTKMTDKSSIEKAQERVDELKQKELADATDAAYALGTANEGINQAVDASDGKYAETYKAAEEAEAGYKQEKEAVELDELNESIAEEALDAAKKEEK